MLSSPIFQNICVIFSIWKAPKHSSPLTSVKQYFLDLVAWPDMTHMWVSVDIQETDGPCTQLEVVCSLGVATSKTHSHLPRWSTLYWLTREQDWQEDKTVTLFWAVSSEVLSICLLKKHVFFPGNLLTWDPEFMIGISCTFHFCACKSFNNVNRWAAAHAVCPCVLWHTLSIVKMRYIWATITWGAFQTCFRDPSVTVLLNLYFGF